MGNVTIKPCLIEGNTLQTKNYAGLVSTTNCLPQAARYLRIVATEGECLPDARARSSRATAGACVPMRSATWACVNPASCRASSNKSSKANSSFSSRSYSLRTAGFFNILALNSSCFSMFNLLHSPYRGFQFRVRRFLGFLDKPVQHHNPPTGQRAIHHTRNPFSTHQPQFKQPVAHRLGVRLSQICADDTHPISQPDVTSLQRSGQAQKDILDRRAVVMNRITHGAHHNKYVTAVNAGFWNLRCRLGKAGVMEAANDAMFEMRNILNIRTAPC